MIVKLSNGDWRIEGVVGETICQLPGYVGIDYVRLVQAAPALLKALSGALDLLGEASDTAPCHNGITTRRQCVRCMRIDAARAAIANTR